MIYYQVVEHSTSPRKVHGIYADRQLAIAKRKEFREKGNYSVDIVTLDVEGGHIAWNLIPAEPTGKQKKPKAPPTRSFSSVLKYLARSLREQSEPPHAGMTPENYVRNDVFWSLARALDELVGGEQE